MQSVSPPSPPLTNPDPNNNDDSATTTTTNTNTNNPRRHLSTLRRLPRFPSQPGRSTDRQPFEGPRAYSSLPLRISSPRPRHSHHRLPDRQSQLPPDPQNPNEDDQQPADAPAPAAADTNAQQDDDAEQQPADEYFCTCCNIYIRFSFNSRFGVPLVNLTLVLILACAVVFIAYQWRDNASKNIWKTAQCELENVQLLNDSADTSLAHMRFFESLTPAAFGLRTGMGERKGGRVRRQSLSSSAVSYDDTILASRQKGLRYQLKADVVQINFTDTRLNVTALGLPDYPLNAYYGRDKTFSVVNSTDFRVEELLFNFTSRANRTYHCLMNIADVDTGFVSLLSDVSVEVITFSMWIALIVATAILLYMFVIVVSFVLDKFAFYIDAQLGANGGGPNAQNAATRANRLQTLTRRQARFLCNVFTFTPNTDNETCAICLEDISDVSNHRLVKLPCEHQYHRACFAKWVRTGKPSCPLCQWDARKLFDHATGMPNILAVSRRRRPRRSSTDAEQLVLDSINAVATGNDDDDDDENEHDVVEIEVATTQNGDDAPPNNNNNNNNNNNEQQQQGFSVTGRWRRNRTNNNSTTTTTTTTNNNSNNHNRNNNQASNTTATTTTATATTNARQNGANQTAATADDDDDNDVSVSLSSTQHERFIQGVSTWQQQSNIDEESVSSVRSTRMSTNSNLLNLDESIP